MTLLANVIGAERKNQNQKINSPNLDLSQVLGTANVVVQTINVDSAQLMGKVVRHVVKRTSLPKGALWKRPRPKPWWCQAQILQI